MARVIAIVILSLALVGCGNVASTPRPTDEGAAAGATDPSIIPIVASSELAIGPNRFLFSLADRENRRIAAPDVAVTLRFYDLDADPDAVVFESDSRFLWAIEDVNGLYAADVSFPRAGRWASRFETTLPDGSVGAARVGFEVHATTRTPSIGAAAPSVDSPIAADVSGDLRRISTDPEPMARMYETSIADAVDQGEPFVLIFATPAFCTSGTCGPMLETVKEVASAAPDVRFIHVEPYILEMRGDALQPVLDGSGWLQPAAWTEAWGLLTEPFIAVVGADGSVRAKYEGAITADELADAIETL